MRKSYYILSFVFCSLFLVQTQAQPRLRNPEYWIGAHGGVSASSVIFVPTQPYMTPITDACVLGGNGGLAFRYAGHKYCAFQIELNYQHRGWATNNAGEKTIHSLHYFEVPIFMNLNFGNDICRWIFNLGPQLGYCVSDETQSIDKPFDWGLAAGTGFYVRTKYAGVYELEVRFDYSFGGVFGTSVTDPLSMASPIDLSLNLGWYFPIVKDDQAKMERMREKARKKKAKEAEKQQKELEREYQIY